jgi:hypothetical protein
LAGFRAGAAALLLAAAGGAAHAGGVYGNSGLSGGYRWDAAPRNILGNERSLAGGLRYSMQGGSYQAFRDLFSWQSLPSVADFQLTVEQAFNAWTAVDPATGLTTALSFAYDQNTAVVGVGTTAGGVNIAGAEIDLLAATDAGSWNPGSSGLQGETYFQAFGSSLTLTSGSTNYGAGAIGGADITLNNNPQARYTLDVFRLLLSHEIGHALGFADADVQSGPAGNFLDDNYDGSSNASALATLTNSWALLVNPLNPAASSGLSLYTVLNGQPGIDTPGVNILMESEGLGGQFGNLTPLSNDDYGMRQFLYPSLVTVAVPEPGSAALMATVPALLGSLCAARRRRRRRTVRG